MNCDDGGTNNVLQDLGLDAPEGLSAKAALAFKLNALIDQRGLSLVEVAAITGMIQSKVSQVRRYKLRNISLEQLMQALVSLDQHVEIVVQPAQRAQAAGITVKVITSVESSITESLRSDLSALYDAGAVSKAVICEFDALCPLPARPSDQHPAEKNGPESGAAHRN